MSTREALNASPLDDELRAALCERDAQNLQRRLRSLPADVLDLASNDYLGLSRHPLVIEAAQAAVAQWGSGARASRLVSGHTSLHQELEAELAAFKGCDAALVFSSGYAANISVITALARAGDFVLCDKRNHASLIDACRLAAANGAQVRYYGSLDKLRALLSNRVLVTRARETATIDCQRRRVFMDGDVVDLLQLLALADEFDATIVLDDAHGLARWAERTRRLEHFGHQ
jgi:7-keto-8-aminopelargonate synthetase-like enzyme